MGWLLNSQFYLLCLSTLLLQESKQLIFFEVIQLQHIPVNLHAYNSVLYKTQSWEQSQFWLAKVYNDGFLPDAVTYSILLNLAPDFATAQMLFQEMKAKGIKAD